MIARIMMLYTLYNVLWSHTDSIDNIWYDASYTKFVQLLNIEQREFYFVCKRQIIISYKKRIFSQEMSRKFSTINNWILQDYYAKLLQQTQKILSNHVELIFFDSIKQRFVKQRFIILIRSIAWEIAESRQSMINSWSECSYKRQWRLNFDSRQKKIFRNQFEVCHYSYELQKKMSQITCEQSICISSFNMMYLRFWCITQLVCLCFCITIMSLLKTENVDDIKHLVDSF